MVSLLLNLFTQIMTVLNRPLSSYKNAEGDKAACSSYTGSQGMKLDREHVSYASTGILDTGLGLGLGNSASSPRHNALWRISALLQK